MKSLYLVLIVLSLGAGRLVAGPQCADISGDVNADGGIDLSDAVYSLAFSFQGGTPPKPFCIPAGPKMPDCTIFSGDVNGDGGIDLSDAVYSLGFFFQGDLAPLPACPPDAGPEVCHSGTYYAKLGNDARHTLAITQTGETVSWTLTGAGLNISGNGTASGSTLTLSILTPINVSMTLVFSDTSNFQGTYAVTGPTAEQTSDGTITGSKTIWTTYDFNSLGTPQFVNEDYINLNDIKQISYFRSGAGHDYSDDFESCRSMKHYYIPKDPPTDPGAIAITSPVNGTVSGYSNGWAGTTVGVESTAHPGVYFILFHINLTSTLDVGETVAAGQSLGTHIGNMTSSDIAVGITTPTGWRLVSFLETMTSTLFTTYVNRNLASPATAIHTEVDRDADPLTCSGEEFGAPFGSLPNYEELAGPH